jgi:hypothetical protein
MALENESPDDLSGYSPELGEAATDMMAGSNAPVSEGVSAELPAGDIEQAKAQVQIAKKTLEPLLAVFGSDSEMGKSLMDAMRALAKGFPMDASADLTSAETANMVQGLPQQDKQMLSPELMGAAPAGAEMDPALMQAAGGEQIPPELLQGLG